MSAPPAKPQKPTFETIPREIRDAIYGYCLLYDGEIHPYPHGEDKCQTALPRRVKETHGGGNKSHATLSPLLGSSHKRQCSRCKPHKLTRSQRRQRQLAIALLRVNHKIHDEAASILYGQNMFRVFQGQDAGHGSTLDSELTFWTSNASYFRSMVITIDTGENNPINLRRHRGEKMESLYALYGDGLGEVPKTPARIKLQIEEARNLKRMCLEDVFDVKSFLVNTLAMNLRTLIFDFEKLMCPGQMCRKRDPKSCCQMLIENGVWIRPGQKPVPSDLITIEMIMEMWADHDERMWIELLASLRVHENGWGSMVEHLDKLFKLSLAKENLQLAKVEGYRENPVGQVRGEQAGVELLRFPVMDTKQQSSITVKDSWLVGDMSSSI